MHARSPEELASAVAFEAENYIPLPMDSVYLDFQTMGSRKAGGRIDVLMSSIPKSIVDAYVACCKEAGLEPWVLEVESAAIARALMETGRRTQPVGILDLGVSNATFIIYARNAIRFTASIPVGGQQLTRTIAEHLGIDFERAESLKKEFGLTRAGEQKHALEEILAPVLTSLISQIKKYMDFYYDRISGQQQGVPERISTLLLCGGGANLKKLPEFLTRELKVSVQVGDPFANVIWQAIRTKNNISRTQALPFTTALGLALRGIQDQ